MARPRPCFNAKCLSKDSSLIEGIIIFEKVEKVVKCLDLVLDLLGTPASREAIMANI